MTLASIHDKDFPRSNAGKMAIEDAARMAFGDQYEADDAATGEPKPNFEMTQRVLVGLSYAALILVWLLAA